MGLVMSQTVSAFKEADIRQLLKTKSCLGCDLTHADLSGAAVRIAHPIPRVGD